MAEITDTLKLDIDQALRDVQRIEAALDRALAPVEIRVDDTSIQRVEDSLRDVQRVVDDTTDSVRLTADEYREVARAVELGVDPARAIARATGEVRDQANLAEADFRDVASALGISEDAARDLAREVLDAQQASQRLEDAVRDVAHQLGLSDSEARELTNSLQRADRAADNIKVTSGGLVGVFGSLRGAAAGVAGVLATIGIGQGIALAARGAVAAVGQFSALNESINAVKVTFEEGADAIFEFGETSAQTAGLAAQTFQQAVVPIGGILRNFGLDAGEAADASIILVQRAADLASVYNVDVADALLAINSALVGQVEPLRRFGAEISVARVEAFLLASGMVASADEIGQAALVQGRLALILQDTSRAAGDFANTSGEFANASRTAREEVKELAASAGEALLPAFEALLGAIPGLVEGLETGLVPVLADVATQVAAIVGSIQAGTGGGVADEIVGITTGIGTLFDISRVPIDLGQLVFGNFIGDAARSERAVNDLTQRLDNERIRSSLNRLIGQMQEGVETADAFADEITSIGVRNDGLRLLEQSFTRLVGTAGLSGEELEDVLEGLIDTGDEAGLTADVMSFLNLQLQLVENSLSNLITETVGASGAFEDLGRGAANVEPVITALDAITLSAELAEVSISEFVLSADPIAQAMVDALDPADRLDLILEAIGEDAALAAEAFRASLTPALIDANEALVDFNENGVVTLDEFIRASEEAAIAVLAFKANIAIIAETSPEVAASLLALGAEQGALIAQGFVDNPIRILEQEDILLGTSTGLAETINDLVSQAVRIFSSQGPDALADFGLVIAALFPEDPALVKQITDRIDAMLLKGIDPDRIRAAFSQPEAATAGAVITVDAYVAGLEQNLAADVIGIADPIFEAFGIDLTTQGEATTASYLAGLTDDLTANVSALAGPIFNLFDIDLAALGAEARSTYFDGLTTPSESETTRLRRSLTEIINEATFRGSPPKLFLDFGEEAGDAYWSGFEQADQLDSLNISLDTAQFGALGVSAGQSYTQGISDEIRRFDEGYNPGDFGFTQGITDEIRRFDEGYNPGDYGFMTDQEIQFDFNLRDFHEKLATALETGNVEDIGLGVRDSFVTGLSTPGEGESARLRASIVALMDAATDSHSPSQLFLDFGQRSGDAFWSGFNQSELTLRTPAPPTTGSIAGSTVAGQTVGGVNVEVNINNPTVNDAVSDTARVAQFASSIAASYRSVT